MEEEIQREPLTVGKEMERGWWGEGGKKRQKERLCINKPHAYLFSDVAWSIYKFGGYHPHMMK